MSSLKQLQDTIRNKQGIGKTTLAEVMRFLLEQNTFLIKTNLQFKEAHESLENKVKILEEKLMKEKPLEQSNAAENCGEAARSRAEIAGNVIQEIAQQDSRKKNIIIRGVEEDICEDEENYRRTEQDSVLQVLKLRNPEVKLVSEDLESVSRLGQPDREKRYRPLLVKMKCPRKRDEVTNKEGAFRLRKYNAENDSRIRVEPDLTKQQREQYQQKWEEAKTKNAELGIETGNLRSWVVCGPKDKPVLKQRKGQTQDSPK